MSRSCFSLRLLIFLFIWSAVLPIILATRKDSDEYSKEDDNREEDNANNKITTREPSEEDEITECPDPRWKSGDIKNTKEKDSNMILDIKGPCAAVFTPCHNNGEINYDAIPEYVKYLNETGIKGILVCATPGEGPALNITERKNSLEAFMKETTKYKLKVMVQIGGPGIPELVELTKHAQKMKADAIVVLPHIYYKASSINELVDYLEVITNAGPNMPLIYDAATLYTGVYVNIRQFFRAASARLPKFVGVAGQFSLLLNVVDLVRKDQKLFAEYHSFATNTLIGFDTSITTVSNVFLDQALAITEAVNKGDFMKAKTMQDRLSSIVRDIEALGEEAVPIWKATMEIKTGLKLGPVRSPEENLTKQQIEAIYGVLDKYGVEIKSRKLINRSSSS